MEIIDLLSAIDPQQPKNERTTRSTPITVNKIKIALASRQQFQFRTNSMLAILEKNILPGISTSLAKCIR